MLRLVQMKHASSLPNRLVKAQARFLRRTWIGGLRRLWHSKILLVFYLLAIVTLFALDFAGEIAQKIRVPNDTESKFFEPALDSRNCSCRRGMFKLVNGEAT